MTTKSKGPHGYLWQRLKQLAFADQGGRCRYCDQPLDLAAFQGDHVEPRAIGGRTVRSNVVAACRLCNQAGFARIFRDVEAKRVYIRTKRGIEKKIA